MKTVIKNISELIQTEQTARKWVAGKEMSQISTIKNAFVEIEDGIITSFGSMDDWKGIEDWNNIEIIDAEGGGKQMMQQMMKGKGSMPGI